MKDGIKYIKKHKSWRVFVVAPHVLYYGYCATEQAAQDLYNMFHQVSA